MVAGQQQQNTAISAGRIPSFHHKRAPDRAAKDIGVKRLSWFVAMQMPEVKTFSEGPVQGFLHLPAAQARDGLVLTHGAGGNCQTPLLVKVAEAFASSGFCVLRCDLPFRQRRRFGPPVPAQAADDRSGLKSAADAIRKLTSGRVFLGGHSYGGRQASLLASEDPDAASGLLLLSYPLHPPKKPDNQRTMHFPGLRVPCLFVHGTRDPFGSIAELQDAMRLLAGPSELSVIEGAGHELAHGNFDLAMLVADRFQRLAA